MHTSKWVSYRALLDIQEMQALLAYISPFSIYQVSEMIDLDKYEISHETFLSKYAEYIHSLQKGEKPLETRLKPYFSTAFSKTPEAFYMMEARAGKGILKIQQPVVQLSLHHFIFSKAEESFHSTIHTELAVTWGLQFAFPQIYSNSIDHDVIEVYRDATFPNTQLFKTLAQWMRRHTAPASFLIKDRSMRATFRLGKGCHHWIEKHPQLQSMGLSICV